VGPGIKDMARQANGRLGIGVGSLLAQVHTLEACGLLGSVGQASSIG
jgi:hypothetical protein